MSFVYITLVWSHAPYHRVCVWMLTARIILSLAVGYDLILSSVFFTGSPVLRSSIRFTEVDVGGDGCLWSNAPLLLLSPSITPVTIHAESTVS